MGRFLLRALIAKGFVGRPAKSAPEPATRRRMLLERLEDRLLFDAGPVAPVDADPDMAQAQAAATAQQVMQEASSISEPADVRLIAPLENVADVVADLTKSAVNQGQESIPDANSSGSATVDGAPTAAMDANANDTSRAATLLNTDEVAQQLLTTSAEHRSELQAATTDVRHELVFVDANLLETDTLLAGVDPRAEVVRLDASRDGVDQMLEVLSQRNDVSAIHLVSHGQSGELHLGTAVLNLDTMSGEYADRLQQIGQHLSADADILVYGCDFAKGLVGLAAEEMLANLTGADVAGSVDATGSTALGGNWILERDVGHVQTGIVFDLAAQQSWQSLLAKLDWDTVNWPSGSLSQSYSVGGGTVSLTLTGSTNRILSGPVDNTTNTGGLSPVEQSLLLDVNYSSQTTIGTEAITATIDFSHPGGVSNVSFSLFDIDSSGFTDQVVVTANNGTTINPSSVAVGSEVTFDGVNKATGTANNNSTSANGNATFTFNQSGITQIKIVYQSGQLADPSEQFISLHDISFNSPPSLDLDASGAGTGFSNTFTEGGSAVAIADTDLLITDADSANLSRAIITLTNPRTSDLLSVSGSLSGGISIDPSSTSTMIVLTGTSNLANYQASIQQIRFSNSSQSPDTTTRSITVAVQDDTSLSSNTATATISVVSVNDTPTTSNNTVTTPEDTPITFAASDFPFSDVDAGDTLQSVKITSLPSVGSLTLSGVAVAANDVIPVASIGNLVFTPALNGNGSPYTTFGFQVSDGTVFSSTATQTVNVTPVNDTPTTANHAVTTPEDTPVTFASSDFPFSDVDVGDTLQSVKITSLPASGSLTLSGVAVAANDVIPVSSVGNLMFSPALNGNGSPYATFGFQVSDGTVFSSTATQTVNVTPVNDAPTTANRSVTTPEDTPVTFAASDFPFNDVDAGDTLQSVMITSLPASGSLTLSGVAVAANDVISVVNLGNLAFTPAVNQSGSPYATFDFQVSDGTAFSNPATMTVNVIAVPDLTVTVDDGGVIATANDTVVYSLSYANNGMQDSTGVFLLETVPTGSTFNAAASSLGWINIGGDDYRLDIGSLTMSSSGTALFAVTVNSTIAAGQTQLVNSVSIADDGTHGIDANSADNIGSDTTPLDVAPDLQLTKSDGTTAVTPGASVVYSLGYANNGTQDATGVSLTETLPTGATFDGANSSLGWSFVSGSTYQFNVGNVAVGSSGSVLFAVTVNSVVAAGQNNFVNSATITDDGANGPDLDPSDNSPTDTDTLNAQPDYQLTLSDAVASVVPGDAVTYTVTISNTGNQDGTGIVVSGLFPNAILHNVAATGGGVVDETAGTISWNVGNFAVGALQTFTITADVWPTIGAGFGNYTVTASITDDLTNGTDPTPANNLSSDTNTLDAAPDLRVSKTDFTNTTTPGKCLVYSVSIANDGNQDATNVVVTETVPVGTTFNSGLSDPLWMLVAPDTYQITLASLAAGASFNVDFDVNVASTATSGQNNIVNTVTISDDGTNGSDPNPGDNTGSDTNTLVAQPDYQITISDGATIAVPGQALSYSIRFTNTGDQNGSGVVVTDTFPIAILENVVASDGGVVDAVAGTITWNVGNLAVGDARTFTVSAKVRDTVPAGFDDFTHDTTITDDLSNGSDPTPGNNSGSDTDTLNATPDYHIAITDGETAVAPGQSLSYTVSFLNTGLQDGTGIVVSDTFPIAILENVIASDGGIVDSIAGTITWNVGNLAAGESRSFTVTAKVRDTIPAGWDDFTHSTTISDDSSNGADPTPADNAAADNDTLSAQPDYQISIDDGVLSATTGQSLTYSVLFANAGFQDGTGVVVTNSLPLSVLTNVVASNGGLVDMTTGTITWNVGNLAAGTSVTFTVTADVLNSVAAGINDFTHSSSISDNGANGTDPNAANNSASDTDTLNAAPDLRLTKTDFTNSISPGQGTVYTLNVSNIGTQGATNVLVTETVPIGTTFNPAFSDPA